MSDDAKIAAIAGSIWCAALAALAVGGASAEIIANVGAGGIFGILVSAAFHSIRSNP